MAKSNAQRQREWRDRHAPLHNENRNVTPDIQLQILDELKSLHNTVRNAADHLIEKSRFRYSNARNASRARVGEEYNNLLPLEVSKKDQESILPKPDEMGRKAEALFDQWWQGYPHKVGKGGARKAFAKALTKTSLDLLVAGVERYKQHKPPDYAWVYPAKWLTDERWNDVYTGSDNGSAVSEHRTISDAEIEAAYEECRRERAGYTH